MQINKHIYENKTRMQACKVDVKLKLNYICMKYFQADKFILFKYH